MEENYNSTCKKENNEICYLVIQKCFTMCKYIENLTQKKFNDKKDIRKKGLMGLIDTKLLLN